jgi:hypothetical protein
VGSRTLDEYIPPLQKDHDNRILMEWRRCNR